MVAAYEAGMRLVDHFWNAMSSTDSIRRRMGTPQRGSMAEFVLYHPEMSTEVIADGVCP
jgi:N-acetylglucosamine-6-phosphate deacetylase